MEGSFQLFVATLTTSEKGAFLYEKQAVAAKNERSGSRR
jgi:hypothetical protein